MLGNGFTANDWQAKGVSNGTTAYAKNRGPNS